jgi:hypothetical protein
MCAIRRIEKALAAQCFVDSIYQPVIQRVTGKKEWNLVVESRESRNCVKIIIGIEDRASANKKLFDFLIISSPASLLSWSVANRCFSSLSPSAKVNVTAKQRIAKPAATAPSGTLHRRSSESFLIGT